MTRGLPLLLCTIAARLLPASRRSWADGMIAELAHTEDDPAALRFALGCLRAAISERARDPDTQLMAGLWAIALVSAFYAVLRLACAARGMFVLFGGHDGLREVLMRQPEPLTVIARYDAARPIVISCFLALGAAQLATAWFLSRRQIRWFATAWCIALLIAGIAVVIQLSITPNVAGVPSEFHALLLQAVTVPALLVALYHRTSHFREALRCRRSEP